MSLFKPSMPSVVMSTRILKPNFLATSISSKVKPVPSIDPLASAAILTGELPTCTMVTSFSGDSPVFLSRYLKRKSEEAPNLLTPSFLPRS